LLSYAQDDSKVIEMKNGDKTICVICATKGKQEALLPTENKFSNGAQEHKCPECGAYQPA
jgi:hypothetical protein